MAFYLRKKNCPHSFLRIDFFFKRGIIPFLFIFFSLSNLFGKIQIIYPKPNSYIKSKKVLLIGETLKKPIQIKGIFLEEKIRYFNNYFFVPVSLKKGKNKIIIKSGMESIRFFLFYNENTNKPSFNTHRFINLSKCKLCHNKKNIKKILPTPANCTTGICHSSIYKKKFVHGPVAVKLCINCHNPHGSYSKNLLIFSGKKLCFYCHKSAKKEFNKRFIHDPVKKGLCINCHNPHSSNLKFQLKGISLSSFCYTCHKKKNFTGKKFVHGPVGVGKCLSCHNPHASNHKNLIQLPKDQKILCFKCHDKNRFIKGKYVHGPVGGGLCIKCHSPHCSNNRKLLKITMTGGELCFDCHNRFKIIEFKHVHGPVGAGLCLDCHNVHFSNYDKLLIKDNNHGKLCFKCHKNMVSKIKYKRYIHKPVKEKCTLCHNAHSSPYKYQLIGNYKIGVCLKCHKNIKKIMDNPSTKPHKIIIEKGCEACHNPHASNYLYQLFDKTVNKVCIHCHIRFKNVKRGHPVERHPVKGGRNPLNRRKKFNCASCHNPHGSKYDYLLIGSLRDFQICKKCHNY